MKKCLLSVFIIMIGLSLFGCGTDNKEIKTVNVDSKVLDSNIAKKDFYEEIKEMNAIVNNYITDVYPIVMKGNISESTKKDILNKTSLFIVEVKEFSPTAITNNDRIFYDEYKNFLYDSEKLAEYVQQYLLKKDSIYKDFIKDSYNNIIGHGEVLIEMEEKYYQ